MTIEQQYEQRRLEIAALLERLSKIGKSGRPKKESQHGEVRILEPITTKPLSPPPPDPKQYGGGR